MAVWCEPPLSISRIQWLDMRDCIPIVRKEDKYEAKFELLAEALEKGWPDFEGGQARLFRLLEPLPFDADLTHHLERFTGRQWLFHRIDIWLADPSASRIFWITGNPGTGKTAVAAWLCHNRREVAAFHLCRHGHRQKADPRRCVLSIAYQLSTQLPDYAERLNALNLDESIPESDARTLFDNLIIQPLSGNFPRPDRTVLIVIDALDEATEAGKNELAGFIAAEYHKMPPWLRLIITSRPDPEVTYPLQGLDPYSLGRSCVENEKDIATYLARQLRPYASGQAVPETAIERIVEHSQGVFLYAEWVRQELAMGRLSLERLDEFPQGLGGVYARFFERQFPDFHEYEEQIRPALEIISALRGTLSLQSIGTILSWNEYERARFRRSVGSLFLMTERGVQPFHRSVIEWLTDEDRAGPYFLSEIEGRKLLADHCWMEYGTNAFKASDYTLAHLPTHLCDLERWDDLEAVLTDLGFIEKKVAAGMTFDLIRDYRFALDFLPEAREEKGLQTENEERVRKLASDLAAYARREIELPEFNSTNRSGSRQALIAACQGTPCEPTRHERLRAFSQFINSESHLLAKFGRVPGYCVQEAFNSANGGPVATAAEQLLAKQQLGVPLLKAFSQRGDFTHRVALVNTLEGHTGSVFGASITYDGSRAVSGSFDNSVRIWDLVNGICLKTLHGHESSVRSVAITPDGNCAVSGGGSDDPSICVWNVLTGELIARLTGHSGDIAGIAITPDGSTVVSTSDDRTIRVWNVRDGECSRMMRGHKSWARSVSVSADGKTALSGGLDRTLRVWNLENGECTKILAGHTDSIYATSMTPDASRAVSAGRDRIVRFWDLACGECLRTLKGHTGLVYSVHITPDGKRALSGSNDKSLRLWDLDSGECIRTLTGHPGWIWTVNMTPDATRAISGGFDHVICLWDLEAEACSPPNFGHSDAVSSLRLTPDGARAISGSDDGTMRLWDVTSGNLLKTVSCHGRPVKSLSVAPDGAKAAGGTRGGTILLWDFENGESLGELQGHTAPIKGLTMTPDGRGLVSAGWDRTARLWDVANGNCILTMEGHQNRVEALAISSDGTTTVTGSYDGSLCVWDLASGKLRNRLAGHAGTVLNVCLVEDGRLAVSAGYDQSLRLWDLEKSRCVRTLAGHSSPVESLRISPEGTRAVSGDGDGSVFLWDLRSGQLLSTFDGHAGAIVDLQMTTDGKRVVTASTDHTIRLWNLWDKDCAGVFTSSGPLTSLSQIPPAGKFGCGGLSGEVILFAPLNLILEAPIVTAVRIWIHGMRNRKGKWERRITASCSWCGKRFPVADDLLQVIRELGCDCGLSPDMAPCLELPLNAWDEPRLLSECPLCHKPMKFNPFIVDNRGRC